MPIQIFFVIFAAFILILLIMKRQTIQFSESVDDFQKYFRLPVLLVRCMRSYVKDELLCYLDNNSSLSRADADLFLEFLYYTDFIYGTPRKESKIKHDASKEW